MRDETQSEAFRPSEADVIQAVTSVPAAGSSDFDLAPDIKSALPPNRRLRPAAVLVPLIRRDHGLSVVLTRRAATLKHHPGQIAFPGGKIDATDSSAPDAALREATEEIGLPRGHVRILGSLDTHETVTQFAVEPIVGMVERPFHPTLDPREVADAFEVPLGFLMDPANLQVHSRTWQGRVRSYYVIPYGPHYVWGATARILKGFSDRLLKVR